MRLILHLATILLAFLLLVPPAWADWVWPVRGEVLTPYRNGTDPYASGQHRGIDIAAATGTPVLAAASGVVGFAGTAGSSGLTVSVRTADGRYDTSYLHLSSTSVREGDSVAAGQRLGAVGTTGTRSATAPHLHFGVRDAGSRHAYHDPLGFLPPPTATEPPRGAPAPEPAPVPVSPAPAPVPIHAPATRRIPVRAPAPRRVPAGEPRRVPAGEPRRVPAGEPRRVPAGQPRRVPAGEPRLVPTGEPRRVPAGEPVGAPHPLPSGDPARVPAQTPRRAPAADSHPLPEADPGRVAAAHPAHAPGPGDATVQPNLPRATGHAAGGSASPTVSDAGTRPSPGGHEVGRSAPDSSSSSSGPDLGLLLACLGLLAAAAVLGLTGDGRTATRKTRHRIARAFQPMLGRR
jgi:peptidase M23-like protein